MANEIAIGLVIGATLRGVGSAFAQTGRMLDNMQRGLSVARVQQERLSRAMRRGLSDPSRNLGELQRRYQRLGEAIRNVERRQQQLNRAFSAQQAHTVKRRELQGQAAETIAHATAFSYPLVGSIKTYMEQEEAANNLKIAMMKADGTFGKFEEIGKVASELGKDLPGTTKDFYLLAEALKKQGISDDVLTGGALKTSAQLNVLLDMDQFQGGEFLAKFMESHGLKENELPAAADALQRGMYAAGLNKEQMYESMKYYAPKVNDMKLNGLDNTRKIIALEGIAGQQGLEGSTFGTGFDELLGRMGSGPEKLKNATKGMTAEAKQMMKASGVELNFWDKKGNFKGIDAMLIELEKLEKIRAKYGDKGVGIVTDQLFEKQGGRIATVLAQKGKKGLDEMLQKMEQQASLQDRIKQKTATLASALESLGGVWESAVGAVGSAFADDIKEWVASAQTFIEGTLTPFIQNNKALIKTVVGVIGGFVGFKIATLGVAYAFNLVLSPFKTGLVVVRKMQSAFAMFQLMRAGGMLRSLSGIGKVFGVLKSGIGTLLTWGGRLASFLSGALVKGLTLAARAVMWLGRAMLMNPIGLAITAIAAGAYLIYTYWEPIKAFFGQLWDWVSQKFSAAWNWIQSAWSGVGDWVANAWGGVTDFFSNLWQQVTTAFSGGIGNIGAQILNWSPLGLFYQCFAGVMNWFGVELPSTFTGFGANLIDGLVNGIQNAWNAAKEMIGSLGDSIKGWFAEKLGIHSPSRVFAGYGENISQGLAIGVSSSIVTAQKAMGKLGDKVKEAAPSAVTMAVDIAGKVAQIPKIGNVASKQAVVPTPKFAKTAKPALQPKAKGKTARAHLQKTAKSHPLAGAKAHSLANYQPLKRDETPAASPNIVVHFSPNITVNGEQGNALGLREQVLQALQNMPQELERLLQRVMEDKQRRAY